MLGVLTRITMLALVAGTLSAQGVHVAAGYVLAAAPNAPGADTSLMADGFMGGLGVDIPVFDQVSIIMDGRFTRTREQGGINQAWAGGLDVEYRLRRDGVGFRLGVAERTDVIYAEGTLRGDSTWVRASLLMPGLALPLPSSTAFGLHPFGNDNLTTFTRFEYGQAVYGEKLGNRWEGSWTLGLRFGTP